MNLKVKTLNSNKLCCYPMKKLGEIVGYDDEILRMPSKVIDMGLLPNTTFKILHQAPFDGPLYIEYGEEKTKIALRVEEARFIVVKPVLA